MSWLKDWWHYQTASMKGVKPEQRLVYERGKPVFYLNSVAGTIRFQPRSNGELTRFRDVYINRFEALAAGQETHKQFFVLYAQIRGDYPVKSKVNLRTRVQAVLGLHLFLVGCVHEPTASESVNHKMRAELMSCMELLTQCQTSRALEHATPNDSALCPPTDFNE